MRVNWAAILAAAVADWIFGAVWFTVFSNQWKAGLQMSAQEIQALSSHPNFWPYIISFVCSFLIAYVIARVIATCETHTLFHGITTGILIGLAAAVALVTEMVFEARVGSFILISAAYPLLGSILMGIIIGVWKPKTAGNLSPASARK